MDLKLDINGDLDLTGGSASLVTGADRIAQQLKIRLRVFKGEWHLDTRQGMPYRQRILGYKPFSASYATSVFRSAILGVPGVLAVNNLSLEPDLAQRSLAVSFQASGDADLSPIVFEEFLVP